MRNKKSPIAIIIEVFIIASIFEFLIKMLLSSFGFIFLLISALVLGLGLVAIIVLIIKAIGGNKDKKTNIKNNLTKVLNKAKLTENKIMVNEETYLLLNKTKDLSLDDIDIYMNNEYIGSLSEFKEVYPNAYNNLEDQLIKNIKENKEETILKDVPIVKELKKDCAYYITKFNDLSYAIEEESIKNTIEQTIDILKQIAKIENEFGDSKNKTRKLYEYYLPMYIDILANYDRLHDNAIESEEFKQSEEKLIKTANLINTALKTVVQSLTESYYTDLNVNMKTLESILKKDGLVDNKMESK